MVEELTGLRLQVFTTPMFKSCSRGGVSSIHEQVTLVGIVDNQEDIRSRNVEPLKFGAPFEPSEHAPAVVLVVRRGPTFHVEPIDLPAGVGWMSGGAYVASTDSRWGQNLRAMGAQSGYIAASLHDRQE